MKNFPHQYSDLPKLTAALGVIAGLIAGQENVSDDGVLGIALARNNIYTFRDRQLSIDEYITRQLALPSAKQGHRTAARETRRFFQLAGLLTGSGDGTPALTAEGIELLRAAGNKQLRDALWRDAMLRLKLPDASGRVSHPYRIMLRIVADRPGIDNAKLFLCFEARDDSEEEYQRILALSSYDRPAILSTLGVSKQSADNAVKILPSIARHVGDIKKSRDHRSYPAVPKLVTEDSYGLDDDLSDDAVSTATPASVSAANIARPPSFSSSPSDAVDLSGAIEIRRKRTLVHHRAVREIAQLLESESYALYENPYDCLGHKAELGTVLIEVKSLDGSPTDERKQSERALGQIRGYRFFNIPGHFASYPIIDIIAFTLEPSRNVVSFLIDNRITVAWTSHNQWAMAKSSESSDGFSADALFAR